MADRRGNEIWREVRGVYAGYAVPQFSVHRGRLQGMLYRAVCVAGGTDAKLVLYPIAPGTTPERRLTNWGDLHEDRRARRDAAASRGLVTHRDTR